MPKKTKNRPDAKVLQQQLHELLEQAEDIREELEKQYEYRTQLYDDTLLTEKALWLVKELRALTELLTEQTKEAVACVKFDADDGPEDQQTVQSLRDLSLQVGIRLVRCRPAVVTQLVDSDDLDSGHYILLAE